MSDRITLQTFTDQTVTPTEVDEKISAALSEAKAYSDENSDSVDIILGEYCLLPLMYTAAPRGTVKLFGPIRSLFVNEDNKYDPNILKSMRNKHHIRFLCGKQLKMFLNGQVNPDKISPEDLIIEAEHSFSENPICSPYLVAEGEIDHSTGELKGVRYFVETWDFHINLAFLEGKTPAQRTGSENSFFSEECLGGRRFGSIVQRYTMLWNTDQIPESDSELPDVKYDVFEESNGCDGMFVSGSTLTDESTGVKYADLKDVFKESNMINENEYYTGSGQKLRACRYCYVSTSETSGNKAKHFRAEHEFYQDVQTDKYIDVISYIIYKDDDEYKVSHLWYWPSDTATVYDSYKILIKKVG